MAPDAELVECLKRISTATVTTVLLEKGLRHIWMRGPKPLRAGQGRVVGRAFTMRFIPAREDIATPASWASPISTRAAIEEMPKGCIVVADTGGCTAAGAFGEILCSRMAARGVAALVTDGAVRDAAGITACDLPAWCDGAAAPPSIAGVTFVGWNEPIGCGGAAVFPDDIIVADGDGAVVIPRGFIGDVVKEGAEHERFENWLVGELKKGVKLTELYPPTPETKARYEASKK
ncbi:MAG: ribonuclease activity regulator RraA [Alphaproteobacteria bacterium]